MLIVSVSNPRATDVLGWVFIRIKSNVILEVTNAGSFLKSLQPSILSSIINHQNTFLAQLPPPYTQPIHTIHNSNFSFVNKEPLKSHWHTQYSQIPLLLSRLHPPCLQPFPTIPALSSQTWLMRRLLNLSKRLQQHKHQLMQLKKTSTQY